MTAARQWWGPTTPHRVLPLRRVARIVNGGTPAADEKNWGGDVPFVTPPDLNGADGAVILATQRTVTADGAAQSGTAPSGAVLLSTRAPIGHVARVVRASSFNQGCRALVPQRAATARFLAYALVAARSELVARGQGTTFVELSTGSLADLPLPVPELATQERIADFLDRETAQIDSLITQQERFVELLDERKSAVVVAVLGSEVPEARGARLKHHVKGVTQGWSPQCFATPADGIETWAVLKAGAANGGTFRPEQNKQLPPEESARPDLVVQPGQVIVSRANTRSLVGSAAVVEGNYPKLMLSDKLYALTFDEQSVNPKYVALTLGTPRWRDLIEMSATGASHSMLNISQSDILNLPLDVPSIADQRALVEAVARQTSAVDALRAETLEHIALAKERRAALIGAAVTGQIDVTGKVS